MREPCAVTDCTNVSGTKQLCPKHYQALRAKGSLVISDTEVWYRELTPCAVADCTKGAHTNGMCGTHYSRWLRNGDPLLASPRDKPQKTTDDRFWEKVVRTDGCWLWTGKTDEYGKGRFQYNGKVRPAHRYAYERQHGVTLEKGQLVRQTCKVPECVNPDHLRLASESLTKV